MIVTELFENNADHRRELHRTGFWGKAAAGSILFASKTKRFCLSHRGPDVQEPSTWGMWGGAMDPGENPGQAAIRELREETQYRGDVKLEYLWTYKHSTGFAYHNFVAIVEAEFRPQIDWETQGYRWFDIMNRSQWPSPLHFGVKTLLDQKDVVDKLNSLVRD